jgi:sugar phosphate isomerase/epimerase
MKFAICNETFQDWPFERAFAFARECGYTGLEIAPFTIAQDAKDIPPAKRREVRRQAEAAGLEIIGLHWLLAKTQGYYLTSPDESVRRATAEYIGELARLCRDLGGRILVFGSPQQRNVLPGVTMDQAMSFAAEVFRAAMPILEQCDVVLAVEPLAPAEGNFLNRAADAVRLIGMVDHPNCRLHLDCKAMSSEPVTPPLSKGGQGGSIPEIIRANREHLVHFHANDANRQGPGFGELDFVPILRTLQEIGYYGWVSVEVFDYSPGIERLARDSVRYLQKCLTQFAGR